MKLSILKIQFTIFITSILLFSFGSCVTTVKAGDLPDSLFSKNFTEWSELRVSNSVYVKSINGHQLNWGHGTISAVPAGRHSVEVGNVGYGNTINMTCQFLPGKSYMIEYFSEDITTEIVGNNRITTYHGRIAFREYGAIPYPVPGKNESIIEFTLTGSYTRVFVDGFYYKLSSYDNDAASKLYIVLPQGKYRISSLASSGGIDLDLPPNRFLSFDVNTREAKITKTKDDSLAYLGKWRFDAQGDGSFVIMMTFSLDGMGYMEFYRNGVLLKDESGGFKYTAAGSNITLNLEEGSDRMNYRISADSNYLTLNNFLGLSVTLTGARM